jgi:Radical SAM superfamily
MQNDPRENPAYLKLDLYCRGAQLDDSCLIEDAGGRPLLRTRAGLGSGLEAILPGGLYTNIPVAEPFAQNSPYHVHHEDGAFVIRLGGDKICEFQLSPRPQWYDSQTSTGKQMSRVGTLQGTYLGVYPGKVCEYWTRDVKDNCKFCSVGLNLGHDDADDKNVEEVLEVVRAARLQSGITYVDFNTGHYEGETFLDLLEPYIRAVKEETGLLVGVQTPPHADLKRYDELKKMGVNRVSFCFEIFDRERFIEVCPGKHTQYGLDRYLEAVEYCASLGTGDLANFEPWVTNGEIIVGLEEPESSIRAIDWITARGAIPTVCVFRPLVGTDYEEVAAPSTADMVPVFARLYDACMERGLPIGVAPNVHVSLVMLPEECAALSEKPGAHKLNRVKLAGMRKVFGAGFMRRLKAKEQKFPEYASLRSAS